ncbi:hypothetical protein HanXRQr2_Chr13g0571731 [Helianthus annuus]|uniref:Uncharacterized protein n=1 Tax=Helianthus annuus TaxID=4232 RepID=A0A9K3EEP0_HELAN|nr:hypothetical protein HanXRQr2_Chr13g0571731 [Helianthus annuus]KAJ0847871.1 hypothetical protein HanPSC8_Chr13g0550411 [Helianthus annuus]
MAALRWLFEPESVKTATYEGGMMRDVKMMNFVGTLLLHRYLALLYTC